MIQMDFAENFTCLSQDEVVRTRWKTNSVTLVTVMIWFQKERISMVIASDNKHIMVRGQLFHIYLLFLTI